MGCDGSLASEAAHPLGFETMHTTPLFEPHDLETLKRQGFTVEEVAEQLERIRHG